MNAIEAFEQWLTTEGYRPSTVRGFGKAFATFTRRAELPVSSVYVGAARALLRWPNRHQAPATVATAQRYLDAYEALRSQPTNRLQSRRNAQAKRKREAKSIDDTAFAQLAEHTWAESASSAAAAVLALMYATGLRVGDVLRIERGAVLKGPERGVVRLTVKGGDDRQLPWSGAPEEWERLRQWLREQPADIRTVADLVVGHADASTEAHGAAYQRVRTLFKQHAEAVGITERVYPHRIRRTVAIRALDSTRDLAAVQQLLGHRSIATTAKYTDQQRPEALAGLQQTIHPRNRTP